MAVVSREMLSALFDYDADAGVLRYKTKAAQRVSIGDAAGSPSSKGYIQIRVGGRLHRAHRLIWILLYGEAPEFLDHIDGNRTNNRLSNLRPATKRENGANQLKQARTTSSRWKGVSWHRHVGAWYARLRTGGKCISLGYYTNEDDAAMAYNEAALAQFGQYAKMNEAEQEIAA